MERETYKMYIVRILSITRIRVERLEWTRVAPSPFINQFKIINLKDQLESSIANWDLS